MRNNVNSLKNTFSHLNYYMYIPLCYGTLTQNYILCVSFYQIGLKFHIIFM